MQNPKTEYTQTSYSANPVVCTADQIVWAQSDQKYIDIHFLDALGQSQTIMTNETSLVKMEKHHLDDFVRINRHIIVRKNMLEYLVASPDPAIAGLLSVKHEPVLLPVSRRRLGIVTKAITAKDLHAQIGNG